MHFCTRLPYGVWPFSPLVIFFCMEFAKKQYYLPCKLLISLSRRGFYCVTFFVQGTLNNVCGAIINRVSAGAGVMIHYDIVAFFFTHLTHSLCKPKWHNWEGEVTDRCVFLSIEFIKRRVSPSKPADLSHRFLTLLVQYPPFNAAYNAYVIPHGAHWD